MEEARGTNLGVEIVDLVLGCLEKCHIGFVIANLGAGVFGADDGRDRNSGLNAVGWGAATHNLESHLELGIGLHLGLDCILNAVLG